MSTWNIRHLRMRCAHPGATVEVGANGVVAVSAINEAAGLARLMVGDLNPWGLNSGASATDAIDTFVVEAHRLLIGEFRFALADTQLVEVDSQGGFDWVVALEGGRGRGFQPVRSMSGRFEPRSQGAFFEWWGNVGRAMLARVEAVGAGEWAGIEG